MRQLLDYPLLDSRVRPVILKTLLELSTKSGRHPRCFALSDRLQLADHPVAAGSFGDVWKGEIRGETVSVKIMRVYQEADVEALLKVSTSSISLLASQYWDTLGVPPRGPYLAPAISSQFTSILRRILFRRHQKSTMPGIPLDGKPRCCSISQRRPRESQSVEFGEFGASRAHSIISLKPSSQILDVALGLDSLHALKLVHGDLKAVRTLETST